MMGLGLLVPIAVVVVLVYAFRWLPQNERQNPPQEKLKRSELTALDILEQRYARGDISREEYLEMRDDIDR